jgi:hypothetical protein
VGGTGVARHSGLVRRRLTAATRTRTTCCALTGIRRTVRARTGCRRLCRVCRHTHGEGAGDAGRDEASGDLSRSSKSVRPIKHLIPISSVCKRWLSARLHGRCVYLVKNLCPAGPKPRGRSTLPMSDTGSGAYTGRSAALPAAWRLQVGLRVRGHRVTQELREARVTRV